MYRKMTELIGNSVLAEDGEIGEVQDILFSDDVWTVRYVVVETGPWLFKKRFLVPVTELEKPDWESKRFPVSLTRQQVKDCPDIDLDKPVSRQEEIQIHNHFAWNGYWTAMPGITSEVRYPGPVIAPTGTHREVADPNQGNPYLRSTDAVLDYHLQASDGKAGRVVDLILDDETWFIYYLVVDTGGFLQDRHVLIAPTWIQSIRTEDSQFFINVPRDKIKDSPEYDPASPLAREYEEQLYDHYDRSKYWRQST